MPKTRTLLSLVAVPLLALLIACGGGDDDDSSSSSGDGNGNGSSSSQSGSGASGDDRASDSDADISLENCKEYASLESAATAAFGTSSTGFKFDKGALDKLVKASPKEIRADMQTIVDAIAGFYEVAAKAGLTGDPSKLDPAKLQAAQADLEKAAAKLEEKKFTDAAARVEAYFVKHCS